MTSRESAAPLAARPESSSAPCVYLSQRLHRRGRRSACVRLQRVEAWRARCERSSGNLFDEGDVNAINGSEGLVPEIENAQEIGGEPSNMKHTCANLRLDRSRYTNSWIGFVGH